MLEKMDDFFTARIEGYDEHMKSNIYIKGFENMKTKSGTDKTY